MKQVMLFGFLVTTILLQLTTCQEITDDKTDILQWYYNMKQPIADSDYARIKRQSGRFNNNFDYDSNSNDDDDDEWYVFDEVEPEPQTPSRGGNPNLNSNQFGWSPQQNSFQGQQESFQGQQGQESFLGQQRPFQGQQGSFQGQQGSFQGQQGSFQRQPGSFQGQQGARQFSPNVDPNPAPNPRTQLPNSGPPRPSRCVESCNSRTTSEYNPVCGSNGVTYTNVAKLNCEASCGTDVQFQRLGRCAPLLPPVPDLTNQ